MTLLVHGNDILINNEITNITKIGFWILLGEKEYFIPFSEYPCFKKATIEQIHDFKLLHNQLFWEKLDCDIELDALEKPEIFPLKFS